MNVSRIFSFAIVLSLMVASSAMAQKHFDVEFGYVDGLIDFESDGPGIDAAGIFEAEFEQMNMDGSQVAEDPGFASNFTKGNESFMVTSGDTIFLNVNQSSTFGSFLTYFNPVSGQFESTDATMTVEDNSPNGTTDLVVTDSGLSGDLSQFLITSDGSEIDTHVDYILSSGAQAGIYGLLLNIESDNMSGDLDAATSEQFWVLFNNGLTEETFEAGVGNFQAIPEPSCAVIVTLMMVGVARRRR